MFNVLEHTLSLRITSSRQIRWAIIRASFAFGCTEITLSPLNFTTNLIRLAGHLVIVSISTLVNAPKQKGMHRWKCAETLEVRQHHCSL
mmetsp:Transcript_3703/g.7332  ORF Transcript_3703/g.7332 Transcript_3703/m.7332 type:complete len:89 (-) Transcript_3703:60-326(-)